MRRLNEMGINVSLTGEQMGQIFLLPDLTTARRSSTGLKVTAARTRFRD